MTGQEAAALRTTAWDRLGRMLPWALVILLTALNLRYIGQLGPNDDAYITYRVARNLAQGLGPVYNPGERVLTVTTPGYALLLAGLSPLSRDVVLLALVLNGLALLAIGALVIDLSRTTLAAVVSVTLTLAMPLLSESLGMETSLYIASILAAFAAYRRATEQNASQRWLVVTAAAAALALLLRPDGLLVAAAIAVHWLLTARPRRIPWIAVAVYGLLVAPWLLFATVYYGSPVPNTLAAKATQALGQTIPRWGAGLLDVAGEWAGQYWLGALLALLGLGLALARRSTNRLPLLLWSLLYIAGHVVLGVRSYFWYYVPLAPVVALLAGDGVAWIAGWLARRLARQERGRLIRSALLAGLVTLALFPAIPAARTLAQEPELRRREEAYLQTAETLRTLCASSDPTVGMAEVGLIGYISNCRIIDFAGLLQPDVGHLKLGPADKMAWTILRYQPELVVLSGGVNYPFQVADAAWFRQRYETVDIYDQEGFRSVVHRKAPGLSRERDIKATAWRSGDLTSTLDKSLFFEPDASRVITLHAFLPAGSVLKVAAGGQSPAQIAGSEPAWRDVPLTLSQTDSKADLSLSLVAGDQPAAIAWIASDAIPSIHYFAPTDDANQRPRPTIRFDPGETAVIRLAPDQPGSYALELLHRDRPGVALEVRVDGQLAAVVGGTDGWRTESIAMPREAAGDSAMLQEPITVEISNTGQQFARLGYIRLVADEDAP